MADRKADWDQVGYMLDGIHLAGFVLQSPDCGICMDHATYNKYRKRLFVMLEEATGWSEYDIDRELSKRVKWDG